MKKDVNICFFNTTPFWGGGEKWHYEAATQAIENGFNTFFVCAKTSELAKKLAHKNIQQFHIEVNNRSFLNPAKVKKLAQFFRQNNIDVVLFNSPKDLKVGGKAAKKAGIKNIVYRRGIAVKVKQKALTKKLFNEVVTHFVFNSKATKILVTKNYPEIEKTKKTAVIYNALNIPEIPDKQKNTPLIIGNAGRLVEQKNQLAIPKIASLLKAKGVNFKFKIAGEGPLKSDLQEAIKSNDVEKEVELLGFVDDMNAFMSGIDIFVSTAKWEGFGFVLAEAMANKVPVLAFNLSSNPELVIHEKNGYLIEPRNVQEFADRLQTLLEDNELRSKLGNEGYNYAKDNFDAQSQFKKLMEFVLN